MAGPVLTVQVRFSGRDKDIINVACDRKAWGFVHSPRSSSSPHSVHDTQVQGRDGDSSLSGPLRGIGECPNEGRGLFTLVTHRGPLPPPTPLRTGYYFVGDGSETHRRGFGPTFRGDSGDLMNGGSFFPRRRRTATIGPYPRDGRDGPETHKNHKFSIENLLHTC